jgi:hypothetical protein
VVDSRLLSRCGIYCGSCFIYRAERDGGALLDEMAKRFNVPREKITCNGCSGPYEEQWGNCQKCAFKACQRKSGVENCAQCEKFETCPDFIQLVRFTAKRGEEIREGLRTIDAGDGEAWLRGQEKRWSCPDCGYPLMWYDNACRGCGSKIREKPVTMDD